MLPSLMAGEKTIARISMAILPTGHLPFDLLELRMDTSKSQSHKKLVKSLILLGILRSTSTSTKTLPDRRFTFMEILAEISHNFQVAMTILVLQLSFPVAILGLFTSKIKQFLLFENYLQL